MVMPGASPVAQMAKKKKKLPSMQVTLVRSLDLEIPWRREWQPTPVFLPGEFHGQRCLAGYSPWGGKESDTTERLQFLFFLSSPLYKMLLYWHVTYTDSPIHFKLPPDYLYLV